MQVLNQATWQRPLHFVCTVRMHGWDRAGQLQLLCCSCWAGTFSGCAQSSELDLLEIGSTFRWHGGNGGDCSLSCVLSGSFLPVSVFTGNWRKRFATGREAGTASVSDLVYISSVILMLLFWALPSLSFPMPVLVLCRVF